MILKNNVLNWYKYNVSFLLDLLSNFIIIVEKQITESSDNFKNRSSIEINNKIKGISPIEIYKGLDDSTFDLNNIYFEYFPSLQRSSAFLTLYANFETELNNLCKILKKQFSLNISLKDLKDNGIDRATIYLEKVACLNINKNLIEWSDIKELQKIRDLIIHNAGNLANNPNKNIIIKCLNSMGSTIINDNIKLENGFLSHSLDKFTKCLKIVDKELQTRFSGE